jgi:hypothetical protein
MTEKFFNAVSVELGFCKRPKCRGVHIHLLDAGGISRAQAVIACENIEQLIADLREVRDSAPGASNIPVRH